MTRSMCAFLICFVVVVFAIEHALAQQEAAPSAGIPLQAAPAPGFAVPASPSTSAKKHTKHPKLSTQIADLARAVPQRTTPLAANERVSVPTGLSVEKLPKSVQDATKAGLMKINTNGEVQVYIELTVLDAQKLDELRSYGVTAQIVGKPNPDKTKGEVLTKVPTVQGLLPVTMINQVAALPFVRYIRLPDYGLKSTGSVDSQGDQILQAAQARSQFGVDGTGVRIGVISDGIGGIFATGCTSCGPTTAIPSPINTGDLPNATGTRNSSGVLTSVNGGITAQSFPSSSPNLEPPAADTASGVGAEGTAMLEIVHDLSPGAQLYFANASDGTSLSFEQAVNFLAANTDVVVDDISFHTPPFDGTSAVSANTATDLNTDANPIRGYFTAVANQALNHWGESWTDSAQNLTLACPPSQGGTTRTGDVHLFQATSNTIDLNKLGPSIANPLLLPNGATLTTFVVWNDPFSGSSNDYDLYLYLVQSGSLTTALACSVNPQTGSQPPLELLAYTNSSGATQEVAILIQNVNNSAAARTFDMFVSGIGNQPPDLNFYTPSGSVPAQSDAGGSPVSVVSVGAIDQTQCPGPGNCTSSVESYSSQGPTEATPQAASRMKPDVTATDDVTVTGAGGFGMNGPNGTATGGCAIGETPCYFAGTSAAAPHVAAIAALALQSAPCLLSSSGINTPATSRANLRSFITNTAVALPAISQAVPNNIEGFGLVDALAAVTATLPTPNAGANQTVSGTSSSGAAVTLSGSGTDPDSCSLTFTWSGACGTGSGGSPKLTCPLGVNTESLTASNGGATTSLPASSVQITVTDFTISNLSSAATISAGQSAPFNLSLGTQFGPYNNAITLSCSNLPAMSSCSFSSPSVTPGSGTASSTVTISTAPHSAAMSQPAPLHHSRLSYAAFFAGFLPLGVVLLSGKRGRRKSALSFVVVMGLASLCFQTGCSGGGSSGSGGSGGTPAGTYTIQVTGTAGSLSHNATVSLTVQ